MGIMAWKNSTAFEAVNTDFRINEMAESFHYKSCIICKNNNPDPPNLKPAEEMTEDEEYLYKVYMSVKPKYEFVKLHLLSEDGAYYFKCDECLNGKRR